MSKPSDTLLDEFKASLESIPFPLKDTVMRAFFRGAAWERQVQEERRNERLRIDLEHKQRQLDMLRGQRL